MKKFFKIKSLAKINISLNVIRKLKSQFHKIESLITFVKLHDVIYIRNIKSKKYSRFRFDVIFNKKKYSDIFYVLDGGWHFTCIRSPKELEYKLLNFAHHYDFEESGLKINDIKKLIAEKRVMYDHTVDQRGYKWSGKSKLIRVESEAMPNYISTNLSKYKDWLD